jgi:hypothetical protein
MPLNAAYLRSLESGSLEKFGVRRLRRPYVLKLRAIGYQILICTDNSLCWDGVIKSGLKQNL